MTPDQAEFLVCILYYREWPALKRIICRCSFSYCGGFYWCISHQHGVEATCNLGIIVYNWVPEAVCSVSILFCQRSLLSVDRAIRLFDVLIVLSLLEEPRHGSDVFRLQCDTAPLIAAYQFSTAGAIRQIRHWATISPGGYCSFSCH